MHNKMIKWDKYYIVLLSLLFLWSVVRLGHLPGLYGDTMQPDYGGIVYVFQQNHSASYYYTIDHLLPTGSAVFYQGNISLIFMMMVSLFTGTTSVMQYHIGEAVWNISVVAALCWISFHMFGNEIKRRFSYPILVSLIFAPAFVTTTFTQYDVFMPGVLFSLLHLIFITKWIKDGSNKNLFIASSFVGLAFSTYFCYLLFAVPLFFVVLSKSVKKKNVRGLFSDFFVYSAGIIVGCYTWLVGLLNYMIALNQELSEANKTVIWLVVCACIAIFDYVLYKLSMLNEKDRVRTKIVAIIFGFVFCVTDVLAFINIPIFKQRIMGKIGGENNLSLLETIMKPFHDISFFTTDYRRETLILGYNVSRFPYLFRNLMIILFVIWFIAIIIRNKKAKLDIKDNKLISLAFLLLFYGATYTICTIPISRGLNPHHYTVIYVLIFLLAPVLLSDLRNAFIEVDRKWIYESAKVLCVVGISAVVIMNYINLGVLTSHIKRTGGHGYYTNQLTELAEDALERQANGEKVFYFLPEWGFDYSFMYLTQNQIPFSQAMYDREYLQSLINEGHTTFVIAYMTLDENDCLVPFTEDEKEAMEKKTWYSLDGKPQFVTMTYYVGDNSRDGV